MKKIKYLILLVTSLLSLSLSCGDDSGPGEPTQWFHIFQLVDKDGRDFISTHPNYAIENIQACVEVEVNNIFYCIDKDPLNEFHDFEIKQVGEKTYLCLFNPRTSYNNTIYLDFGNGDVDTLTFSSQPQKNPNPFWTNINEFHFFYNDRHVHTYDLKNDNPPRLDLYSSGPILDNTDWQIVHSFTITKLDRDSL